MTSLLDEPLSKFTSPPQRKYSPAGLQMLHEAVEQLASKPWSHPDNEAGRLAELEGFLAKDFETFREVRIECQYLLDVPLYMRIDLLAVPRLEDLDVVLAFEVKRKGFDVERSLKQSSDYVGGRVLEGPHTGKRIAACFLYPLTNFGYRLDRDRYHEGMFNLIAQWRVGRGFISRAELVLAIGFVVIWRSQRGWVASKASDMLLGKRSVGGSRKALPEMSGLGLKEWPMQHEEESEACASNF
jgi:hypothetical protein